MTLTRSQAPFQPRPRAAATRTVVTRGRLSGLGWVLLFASVGCRSHPETTTEKATKAATPPVVASAENGVLLQPGSDQVELVERLETCEIDYYGPTLDLGAQTSLASAVQGSGDKPAITSVERGGATFARIETRRVSFDLWLDQPLEQPRLSLRLVPLAATRISTWLDSRPIGTQRIARGDTVTLGFAPLEGSIPAGRHTVSIELRGRPSGSTEALAELDWIHFGVPPEGQVLSSIPTRRDVLADQEIGKIPRRSLVLRAPGILRCPLHLAVASRFKLSLGFWGTGSGVAEVRMLEDGQPPVVLHQRKVTAGQGAEWIPIDLDLAPFIGRVVALELRVLRATQGGRVVFGEPRIVRAFPKPQPEHKPKVVVLVVAASCDRRKIPPFGPIGELATFGELQRQSVVFPGYRVPTSLPAGVVASLLTGLPPSRHGVEDISARLSSQQRVLSQWIKQASGRTAMFTGVPTTFPAFGFNAGWDEFQAISPVKDVSAEEPLLQATRWLSRELAVADPHPRFVLVHSRGMHPPWDLTKDEVAQLQPTEYGGALDARRGGITLGRIRRQTLKGQRRLSDEDWTRFESMTGAVLADESVAIGQLIETLKRHDLWKDTLFVFTGDVAAGDAPAVPFDPIGQLREDQLTVPLIIKFPGQLGAGTSSSVPVTTTDLTRTILDALGIEPAEAAEGINLLDIASGRPPLLGRALTATLGKRYSTRVGTWQLFGEVGRVPHLCQVDVDPMCMEDLFGVRTLASRALWSWTHESLRARPATGEGTTREPASIDADTAAALTVWGDIDQ